MDGMWTSFGTALRADGLMTGNYQRACEEAIRSPEAFWGRAAEAIQWHRPWQTVLDRSNAPFYRWFTGGELNTCYNALDYHVEHGRADQLALIYDSPVTGTAAPSPIASCWTRSPGSPGC